VEERGSRHAKENALAFPRAHSRDPYLPPPPPFSHNYLYQAPNAHTAAAPSSRSSGNNNVLPSAAQKMIEAAAAVVVVREYDAERDHAGVEEVERACEVGCSGAGKMSLFTDLLGDPLCRIRNSPAFLMLVRDYCTIPTCLLGCCSVSLQQFSTYVVAAAAEPGALCRQPARLPPVLRPRPPVPPSSCVVVSSRFVSFRLCRLCPSGVGPGPAGWRSPIEID
jgi:hypothetical protein